jgi:hypothetical protein
MLRCYKQDKIVDRVGGLESVSEEFVDELVTELLHFSHCELLLLEAGS